MGIHRQTGDIKGQLLPFSAPTFSFFHIFCIPFLIFFIYMLDTSNSSDLLLTPTPGSTVLDQDDDLTQLVSLLYQEYGFENRTVAIRPFYAALDAQLARMEMVYTSREMMIATQLPMHESGAMEHEKDEDNVDLEKQLLDDDATEQEDGQKEATSHYFRPNSAHNDATSGCGGGDTRGKHPKDHLFGPYASLLDLDAYVTTQAAHLTKALQLFDFLFNTRVHDAYHARKIAPAYPFLPTTAARRHQWLQRLRDDATSRQENMDYLRHKDDDASRSQETPLSADSTDEIDDEKKNHKKSRIMHVLRPFLRNAEWRRWLRPLLLLAFAVIVFAILLNVDIFHDLRQNACFALLVLSAMLWATEAIPLYATSLLVPFLIVVLGVMRQPGDPSASMPAPAAAKAIFQSMFSSTIMMLLGGFALAQGFQKYGLAQAFAVHILTRAGTRPAIVLLAIMLIAAFLSMWISNVATPVLCYSLIQPLLRRQRLPCFVLGIALASSLAGMLTPISSPQNIITLAAMPGFGWGWLAVSLPIGFLSLLFCWLLLVAVYRPQGPLPPLIVETTTNFPSQQQKGAFWTAMRWKQAIVLVVTIVTVLLWCLESVLHAYIGSAGVIACIPLFIFFGTGLLDKDDLQHGFLWPVVVLAQGGMALGEAVARSGLLEAIALHIKDFVVSMPLMAILAIFSLLILVFATFVSHTVAALIIIPIVQQVGEQLPIPHPNLLVMGAGLACST
ncbi:hypothetical protein BC940DRAFT_299869 [Gongronella butleri]|nr:hypothetical protein BC940DRAFT_299869 [Gongronella butleri]